jgi:dTDP-L-rhamnose 4-epimerase
VTKHVLITGGAGFIGSHVVDPIPARGQRVRVPPPGSGAHDITAATASMGHEPMVRFEDGLVELVQWLESQTPEHRITDASCELEARGLTMEGGT